MTDKSQHTELDALIDACLEGRLTAKEAEQLSQKIEESSDARERYWEMALVHGMIEQSMQRASLRAVTGEELMAPVTRARGLSRWPRITAVAAGLMLGFLSASLVWAYRSPSTGNSERETTELLFESFEDPSVSFAGRFPDRAGVWQGQMTTVVPADGVRPKRGKYVARMSPVSARKFSYARRILDLSDLPPVGTGMLRELEVQGSFFSSTSDQSSQYQIRLAVFREDPESIRPIWNDESVLFDRVLNHVGKNHITDPSEGGWRKVRASIEIPPDARCVLVSLAVADVGRDSARSEHYLDAIRFRLVESPTETE